MCGRFERTLRGKSQVSVSLWILSLREGECGFGQLTR